MRAGLFLDPALGEDRFHFDGAPLLEEDVEESEVEEGEED